MGNCTNNWMMEDTRLQ